MFSLMAASAFGQQTISGISKQNMDLSAKPGKDFYEYSAGGWMKAHPLTPEYTRFGQFDQLHENNQAQVRELIEDLAKHPQAKGTLGQKIGSLYNLAMDSVRRNREGIAPLRPVLAKVRDIKSKKDYQLVVAQLDRKGAAAMMFDFGISADIRNAAMNLVNISQGGISLGERDYYLNDDSTTVKVRNAYKAYIKKLFTMVGDDQSTAEKKMQAVMAIETQIAKASYSATQLRDVEGNYHKMSYAQLLKDFPGIDWEATRTALGFPTFQDVTVNQIEPLHEVEKILNDYTLDDLKAYAEFKVIDAAANALDDNFRAASFDFYSKTMSGAQQDRPRWKRAVGVVNGVLGMAVGKMYVEKYFPAKAKEEMLVLIDYLKRSFAQHIKALSWMSPVTKEKALAKLGKFGLKVGYPDKWQDYSRLVVRPASEVSYYENISQIRAWRYQKQLEEVGQKVDKSRWRMTPQTVNAYYSPMNNEIVFPAAILQSPFFSFEADPAVNFGGIGAVIGHEMSHGFDDSGAEYDGDGNLKNWWTAQDKENFKKVTQALAAQFDKYEPVKGHFVNGTFTNGENIADLGGVNIAYDALQLYLKEHGKVGKISGYTQDQRFFLSWATVWRAIAKEKHLINQVKTDPHTPQFIRAYAPLLNVDAWYKAFDVKEGDKLYKKPAERVKIW